MLEREQVLHVAKLARLQLNDAELQTMAVELSAVLDHVDRIRELDLADVEPTSHAVDLAGVMRADVPVPCLDRDVDSGGGARAGRRRFRRSQPRPERRMSAVIELTAAEAVAKLRAGELDAERAVRGLPRARRR